MVCKINNQELRNKMNQALRDLEKWTCEIDRILKEISTATATADFEAFDKAKEEIMVAMNYRYIAYHAYQELQKKDSIENPEMSFAG